MYEGFDSEGNTPELKNKWNRIVSVLMLDEKQSRDTLRSRITVIFHGYVLTVVLIRSYIKNSATRK